MSSYNDSCSRPTIADSADVVVVGLNHNTAPVEVRESLSWNADQLPSLLSDLTDCGIPSIPLSTCNRSEFYFLETDAGDGPKRLYELLTRRFGGTETDLASYLYIHRNYGAVLHLFRVASGLDSMILGEEQIIGQVRQAYYLAGKLGAVPGLLARLFQQSSRVGRRVRRESGIGANALSVSRACVDMARSVVGDLSDSSVLVVGAGEAGQTAAEALSIAGARNITVTNRTHSRAVELADTLSGRAVAFDRLPEVLERSDIVIGCTSSPAYVLEAGLIQRTMAIRPERPMFLIDIAVPRDFDPAAAAVSNVILRNIDDLDGLSRVSKEQLGRQTASAEALAVEEADAFDRWRCGLASLPTVIGLRQHADDVRHRELQRTVKRLGNKLSEEELASLESMTRAIVNKLLHSPTVYLKGQTPPAGRQAAEEIFGLGS